jgi:hypothetical protein
MSPRTARLILKVLTWSGITVGASLLIFGPWAFWVVGASKGWEDPYAVVVVVYSFAFIGAVIMGIVKLNKIAQRRED